jgi:hypothetical protein
MGMGGNTEERCCVYIRASGSGMCRASPVGDSMIWIWLR